MKWLFRFAESQKNVACVIKWVDRIALVIGFVYGSILAVAIILK